MAFNENGNVEAWRKQIAQQEERLTALRETRKDLEEQLKFTTDRKQQEEIQEILSKTKKAINNLKASLPVLRAKVSQWEALNKTIDENKLNTNESNIVGTVSTDIEDLVSTMNSAIANIRQAEIEANGAEKVAEESAKEAYMAVSEANAAKSNSIVYMVEENGQENEQEASRLVLLAEEKANIAKQKSMEANEKREAVQRQKKQIIDAYEKAQAILNEKKNELEETKNAMLEWNKNMEKAKEEVEEADKEAQAAALEANDARKNSVVYMIDESEEENEQKAYNLALIAEEKATIAKQKRSKLESINNKYNNFEDKMKNINNDIQKLTDMLNRVAPIINGEKPNVQPTKPDNEKEQKSVVKPGNGTETGMNTGVNEMPETNERPETDEKPGTNERPETDEKPGTNETQEEQQNISIILNPEQIVEYAEEI